jgi:hypothetical protein
VAQQITLAEAAQSVLRERRVVRDLVLEVELAKPPVGQMQLDLLAQPAFRADAVAVADDEHPDHQLGIDRRTTDVAVMGLELLVEVGERHCREHIDPSQQMVLGDAIFEPELVEQPALIPPLPPHHRPALRAADQSATGITVRRPSQALYRQHRPEQGIAALQCQSTTGWDSPWKSTYYNKAP